MTEVTIVCVGDAGEAIALRSLLESMSHDVRLIRVGDVRTVVAVAGQEIPVGIDPIVSARTAIAFVTDAVAIGVLLPHVAIEGTVVASVGRAVGVGVRCRVDAGAGRSIAPVLGTVVAVATAAQ